MTKQEFENLTEMQVTDERFNEIKAIYMACTQDIDKQTFCDDFKKHSHSVIISDLTKRVELLVSLLDYYDKQEGDTINYLIDLAHDLDEQSIDRRAEKMCSLRTVITRKIEKGYELDAVQLEYIKENLK